MSRKNTDKLIFIAKVRKQGDTKLIYIPKVENEKAELGKLVLVTEINLEDINNEHISKNREQD